MAIKNVTMALDEDLIEKARAEARRHNTSLNALFRLWIADYASGTDDAGRTRRILMELGKTKRA